MSRATLRAPLTTSPKLRANPLAARYMQPATALAAANESARPSAGVSYSIDPMLLVYEERVESLRVFVAALERGYRTLVRKFLR